MTRRDQSLSLGASELPSPIQIEAADLELLPDIGDDPLRAVSRLPGTAAGDFTAKANFRGGEVDETLGRFDGLRLFNPFHFKDFQSIFSAIDPGIIRGIEVYTGAFPATFGDRMSGVIDIESLAGSNAPQREFMLSFFNASGQRRRLVRAGRGQWLLSARRSNLDSCSMCWAKIVAAEIHGRLCTARIPVHGWPGADREPAALPRRPRSARFGPGRAGRGGLPRRVLLAAPRLRAGPRTAGQCHGRAQ